MPKGKKVCPKCSAECGVRSASCEKCGYNFAAGKADKKAPAAKKPAAKKPGRKPAVVEAQPMDFAAAYAQVQQVQGVVASLGGYDQAVATLNTVSAASAKVGGLDALMAAVVALAPAKPAEQAPVAAAAAAEPPAPVAAVA